MQGKCKIGYSDKKTGLHLTIIGIITHKKDFFYALIAVLFFISCDSIPSNKEYESTQKSMQYIKQCYRTDSTKALQFCREMEKNRHSSYTQTVAYLAYADIYEYWGYDTVAYNFTQKAYQLANQYDFIQEKAKACVQFARITRDFEQLRYLQEFEHISEEYHIEDPETLVLFNYHFGAYHRRINQYSIALKYFKKAAEMSSQYHLYWYLRNCLVMLTSMYSNNEKNDIEILNEAEKICIDHCPLEIGNVYFEKAILYSNIHKYEEAKKFMLKAEKAYAIHPHPYDKGMVEVVLGDIYMNEHNYVEAKRNYECFLNKAKFNTTKVWAYNKLYNYYLQTNDLKNALGYKLKFEALNDSINAEKRILGLNQLRKEFEQESTNRKFENEKLKYKAGLVIAILLTLGLISSLVLYRYNKSLQMKLVEAEILRKNMEYESKQRELATHTLQIEHHVNLLSNLKKQIKVITTNDKVAHVNFKPILKFIDNHINDDGNWGKYKMHFEAVSPLFFETLKNRTPSLTDLDLKHCVYIKMHMTPKQVAQVLGITPKSVTLMRVRIKKKLALDVSEPLSEFIQNL